RLTDDQFSLQFSSCLNFGLGQAPASDLIIAIDRAQTLALADQSAGDRSRSLLFVRELIARATSEHAAKRVSLVMFSGQGDQCQSYGGGDLALGAIFPCTYLPLGDPRDAFHRQRIEAFLNAAE